MTRDACHTLDLQHPLGRNSLAAVEPVGNMGLPDANLTCQCDLAAGGVNSLSKTVSHKHCAKLSPIVISSQLPIVLNSSSKLRGVRPSGPPSDFWLRLGELVGEGFSQLNQTQIGKIFGVGQSMVTRWRAGELPALPRAIEIAKKYGVCVEWLLTRRGPKYPGDAKDPEMAQLLEFWDRLLPATRQNIVGYAKIQRSIQNTAPVERIKEMHQKLPEANRKARFTVK